jgi:chemotaxis protein CheZ
MGMIEKQMDLQAKAGQKLKSLKDGELSNKEIERLIESNSSLNNDLMVLMTLLSFQDLTGQRIQEDYS